MKANFKLTNRKNLLVDTKEPRSPFLINVIKISGVFFLICLGLQLFPEMAWGQSPGIREYGNFPMIGSRTAIWIAAQVHLLFAAFVLGVPMFAVVAEAIGIFGNNEKYDSLAKEFTRLLLVAYSATAIW